MRVRSGTVEVSEGQKLGVVQQAKASFVCLCVYLCVCVHAHVRCIMSIGLGCTINRPTEEQHDDNCPLFSCHGNANSIHQRKPGFKKQSILKRGERTVVLQEREQHVLTTCQM